MEPKNVWNKYNHKETKAAMDFAEDYKSFLSAAKTEREAVDEIVNLIEKEGYVELERAIEKGKKLKAGDKVYAVQMNKAVCMFRIGKKPMAEGLNILGAHIDSPRMDVKQNPLLERSNIAYLDTHYYGGIKKYQWVAIPLALHGVIAKKDGSIVELRLGEDEDDPVFFVSDLLIHLAGKQLEKKGAEVVEGELLDLIVGNKPIVVEPEKDGSKKKGKAKEKPEEEKDVKEAVKKGILDILKRDYGMEEEDFISAELEIVPAGKARDAGFDRSMVLGYGHDDKVCAYPSVIAMLKAGVPERTHCCLLVDKEEIGSVGATGMRSHFFENALAEIMNLKGEYSELNVRRCLAGSMMLSSDVSAAYDPNYWPMFEKNSSCYMGCGLVFNKFTGSRGKTGSNDANAEYIAHLRKIMDDAGVAYQTAELGRVDAGGGGTIAYILALYGMNVIDSGVPVLNMHAPWEAISKADLYESLKGYVAFLEHAGEKADRLSK
ncbi:MAG: aminopeptidase [Lachnospiraceae bacterium]|nr:aminopeptidase [Lachnospiraceae bacterium]